MGMGEDEILRAILASVRLVHPDLVALVERHQRCEVWDINDAGGIVCLAHTPEVVLLPPRSEWSSETWARYAANYGVLVAKMDDETDRIFS